MKLLKNSDSGSLNLSTALEESKKNLAEEVDSFRVLQTAQAKIRKAGLPHPRQAVDSEGEILRPDLNGLAGMDNVSLGKLLAELTSVCDYTAYAAAIADVNLTVETAVFEYVRSKVRISKTGKVHESRDKTIVDPRVVSAQASLLEKQAIAALTKVLLENYQRDWQTVSREITRRGQESERI